MPIPITWTTVPIVGQFQRVDGTFPKGFVIFESAQAGIVINGEMFLPPLVRVQLNPIGAIPDGFALPSTTDQDLNITGWVYKVTERFLGGRDPYNIFVPHAAPLVDLSVVAPVATPEEMQSALSISIVATVQGLTATAQAAAENAADSVLESQMFADSAESYAVSSANSAAQTFALLGSAQAFADDAIAAHVSQLDPHSQYLDETDVVDGGNF